VLFTEAAHSFGQSVGGGLTLRMGGDKLSVGTRHSCFTVYPKMRIEVRELRRSPGNVAGEAAMFLYDIT